MNAYSIGGVFLLYPAMMPFFVLSVVLGAAAIGYGFRQQDRPTGRGVALGAAAGLAGPWLFMTPLQSCTFGLEQSAIDFFFGIFFFFLGAGLTIGFAYWVSQFYHPDPERQPSLLKGQTTQGIFRANWLVPVLLLLPTLIILTLFLYYPAVETFRLATLLTRLGAPRTIFKCVTNFTELIDVEYMQVLLITFYVSIMIVVLGLIIGLAIAYLAHQPVKGASIYRTLLIWPYAISPAVAGIIFFVMFDPIAGVINHVLELFFNLERVEWLKRPELAQAVVILASVWKTLGYNILFYIAGLQTVPDDLLEAASIDGANVWQRFRNVVIPALSPITFFLVITNLTYAFFETYGTIDYLTKGGPVGATSVAIYEIIRVGIVGKDLGRGAAQSIVLFIVVIGITVLQFRTSGRRVTYGA